MQEILSCFSLLPRCPSNSLESSRDNNTNNYFEKTDIVCIPGAEARYEEVDAFELEVSEKASDEESPEWRPATRKGKLQFTHTGTHNTPSQQNELACHYSCLLLQCFALHVA